MHKMGILLIAVSGVMEGLFTLPLKLTPRWEWENTWLAGSLAALLFVPWPIAMVTIPGLADVYASAPRSAIAYAVLFGLGWGLGGVFYGRGISRIGISLGTSLIMGLIAISGSVLPAIVKRTDLLGRVGSSTFLIGIAVMIGGLAICAYAGSLKVVDSDARRTNADSLGSGILYCIAAGLLSSLVNFALIFGNPIAERAIDHGARPTEAGNALWAIVFTSNYLFNIGYCFLLSVRNKTLRRLWTGASPLYLGLASIMGSLWAGGIVVYGSGAAIGGPLGPIFGFPIMLIVSIFTGNLVGAIAGEWVGQPIKARVIMILGVSVMFVAIALLGHASYEIRS